MFLLYEKVKVSHLIISKESLISMKSISHSQMFLKQEFGFGDVN